MSLSKRRQLARAKAEELRRQEDPIVYALEQAIRWHDHHPWKTSRVTRERLLWEKHRLNLIEGARAAKEIEVEGDSMGSEILIWPHKTLTARTRSPWLEFDNVDSLIARLRHVMHSVDGLGLAANQLGSPLSVAVVKGGPDLINPVIVARRGEALLDEGCLSVPDEQHKVKRALEIDVAYDDPRRSARVETFTGQLAHIIQHEVDHLEGLLYVHLLSPILRDAIRRRMTRVKRNARRWP